MSVRWEMCVRVSAGGARLREGGQVGEAERLVAAGGQARGGQRGAAGGAELAQRTACGCKMRDT
jgi:hypothetical protein